MWLKWRTNETCVKDKINYIMWYNWKTNMTWVKNNVSDSEDVIHALRLRRRPRWIRSSSICITLHILLSLIQWLLNMTWVKDKYDKNEEQMWYKRRANMTKVKDKYSTNETQCRVFIFISARFILPSQSNQGLQRLRQGGRHWIIKLLFFLKPKQ